MSTAPTGKASFVSDCGSSHLASGPARAGNSHLDSWCHHWTRSLRVSLQNHILTYRTRRKFMSGSHSHAGGGSGAHSHASGGGGGVDFKYAIIAGIALVVGNWFVQRIGLFVFTYFVGASGPVPSPAQGQAWGAMYFSLGLAVLCAGAGLIGAFTSPAVDYTRRRALHPKLWRVGLPFILAVAACVFAIFARKWANTETAYCYYTYSHMPAPCNNS